MTITSQLHQLAEAICRLEDMLAFSPDDQLPHDTQLRVQWDYGSATRGYDELRVGIAKLVQERWATLRQEAIERQRLKVQSLRLEVFKALGEEVA